MPRLLLTRGKVTLVDDEDFDRLLLLGRRWQATQRKSGAWYGVCDFKLPDGQRKKVYLHRWILDAPEGIQVDHVNGDGLDNRRENLRLATPRQNSENQTKPTRSATGFRGVREVAPGSFAAYVNTRNRQVHLGCWGTAEEAAVARDYEVARVGSRARPNFKEPPFSAAVLEASRQEPPRSKVGHPNIREKVGAFEAYVRRDGKRVYVGRFPTIEQALEAQRRGTLERRRMRKNV